MPKKVIKNQIIQPEYDFSKGKRGKYAEKYAKKLTIINKHKKIQIHN